MKVITKTGRRSHEAVENPSTVVAVAIVVAFGLIFCAFLVVSYYSLHGYTYSFTNNVSNIVK